MSSDKGQQTQSNIESFLESTTPIVPSQVLPTSAIRSLDRIWHPLGTEKIEYFTLGDLWSCYDEWSAYGAGVPIALSKEETVVQYYVPYLSAIQIYTSFASLNNFRDGSSGGDSEPRDSFSDSCSDDNESEKSWRWEGGSSNDSGVEVQERLYSQNERLGCLCFQYIEKTSPYGRVPLMDKGEETSEENSEGGRGPFNPLGMRARKVNACIPRGMNGPLPPSLFSSPTSSTFRIFVNDLAEGFHGLMTLKSTDLSPASWLSVAWYPIYHIPTGKTVKDLSACFLTYHTISSSFQDVDEGEEMGITERKTKKSGIALSPFGFTPYKMQGNVWFSGEDGQDQERVLSLYSAADSWLKQLRVQHHDFCYFTGIRHG